MPASKALKSKFVIPLSKVRKSVLNIRKYGLSKGDGVGFTELSEHWTIKRGSTSYILAAPASGKTTVMWEILMNMAEFEDYVCAIYSPESGAAADIYSELCGVYLRKPFKKDINTTVVIKESDVNAALDFVSNHFIVIDSLNTDATDKLLYQSVLDIEEGMGVKIDALLIDSFSDISIEYGQSRDISFGLFLTTLRRFASTNNLHVFLTFHTIRQAPESCVDIFGARRTMIPPPTANDIMNGMYGFRKAFFLIGLWRTPYQIVDPVTSEAYPDNELRIEILKAKPKHAGKMGVVKMYYDWESARLKDSDGNYSKPNIPPIENKKGKKI